MGGAEEIADAIIGKILMLYARMPIRHAEIEGLQRSDEELQEVIIFPEVSRFQRS